MPDSQEKEKEKDKTYQALKESEELYKALVKTSPDAIQVTDLKGKIIEVSKKSIEISGAKNADDLIGKNSFDFIDPEDKELAMTNLLKTLKEGELKPTEYTLLKVDGTKYLAELSASVVKNREGKPIAFIGVVRDINESKRTENMLKESEEKYRELVENINASLYIIDINGVMSYISPVIETIIGFKPSEVVNRPFTEFVFKEDHPRAMESFQKTISGQSDRLELRLLTKNGQTRWIYTYVTPVYKDDKIFGNQGLLIDITERKNTERKLKESEEKFRTITEQSLMGISIIQDGILKYINQTYADMAGYSVEDMLNWKMQDWVKRIYPDDLDMILKLYDKVIRGDKDMLIRIRFRLLNKNNEPYWVETFTKNIQYQGKNAQFITSIDITDRVNVELKLKESEERYRYIFERAPYSINIMDFHGNIIEINKETENLVGYKKEELLGQNYLKMNIYDKELIPALGRRLDRLQKGESIEPLEVLLTRADGKKIWVSSHLSIINLEDKAYIQAIILDINARKIYEKELKESEKKYRSILENIEEGYFEVDIDGSLTYVNDAFCEVMGYSREELLGKNYSLFMDEQNARKVYEVYNQIFRSGKSQINFDYEARRKDGKHVYVDSSAYLQYDETGKRIGFYGFGRDFTERKEAELLIKEERDKLKELDQLRKDLISRVSHELKTPIATISGASELLLGAYREMLDKDSVELIEIIEKGGDRLKTLVESLLDVSKIEFSSMKLNLKTYDLCKIIQECVKDMSHLIKERDLELSLALPDDLRLRVDRIRIEQVITNLLSNAIKNTPPKGKIDVALERYQKWAIFSVKDTGIGLTIEETKILFKRFGKIERYGEGLEYIDIGGSGLGLYISKQIVELHEGKIWVESEGRNKGTTFTVRLPIK